MNSSGDVGLLPVAAVASSNVAFASSSPNPKSMIINPPTTEVTSMGVEPSNVKWTKINDALTSQSIQPRPRHGHRSVAYGNMMVVFGGGNEGIVEEVHVFDTTTHEWFQPQVKGEIPLGCAAYGLALDGCRMLMFGGMSEYGRYSNDLYELNIPKWEWKKLKPKGPRNCEPPCARLGHSFTIIRDQIYMFGGLANESDDLKVNIPRYMNDMYILQVRLNNEHGVWDVPVTFGNPPGPRESHSAVAYVSKDNRFNKLIVYGGMSGCRLGDLYILDVDTLMWCKPEVKGATPSPRSLHTATLVGDKMYVFGGWVPMMVEELKTSEKEWKCTNSLACLNVDNLQWENLHQDILDDKVPRARAGHSAVVINTRIYIWSGRDGYRKAWNNQVCCKDLWQLEVQRPGDPGKVQLLRAGTNWLEVGWNPVPGADTYLLQCVAYDVPLDPIFQQEPSNTPLQSFAAGFSPSTTPIMTPVPTSKPAKSPVPPPVVSSPSLQPMVTVSHDLSAQIPQSLHATSVPVSVSVTGLPTVVSQQGSMQIQLPVSQALGELPASSSIITLSMPSLAPTTAMSAMEAATIVTSASSGSPAVLPSASSMYTLPANVAGTASSLLASKNIPRQVMSQVTTNPQSAAGRGVLRLRTPVQVTSPRTPGTVVTTIPSGATVLKTSSPVLASNSVDVSAQMSGMNALAAAAAATQKIQTPQAVKVVQQPPGQPQVFSQVKMASMSGVLPPGVRLTSPVTSGKPTEMKQIIVKNPGTAGAGNQIYTVVKTSQGMALANFQGQKVIQGKPGTVTTTNVVPASSIQGSPQKGANIIKWVAAPGSTIPAASKPNIIATNQPILGLAGQGSPANSPRPTYIISKPATTMASRPQAPQYVVVTQASAIRSIQGMAASSLAGGQTITLPTSVATAGGSPQGVKMIVMPSGSGPPTGGQSVKIITPQGMQTATAPKTVTLGGPKQTQYLTSGGQIVTLPPGILQPGGQQQISIGGKQVTLQMAGGQKLAILSNSSGQIIQSTSQNPGDPNKPKFVMVGPGQKPPIPISAPMRILHPDSTTTSIGDGIAAESLVEMAAGEPQQMGDQNGINMDGDQSGLKGGSLYGPWSTFDFNGPSWMKLKGGGNDPLEKFLPRNSTIPIYSIHSKFSWRTSQNFGLKGGAEGDGDDAQPTQESQSAPETSTSTVQIEQQAADSTTPTKATSEGKDADVKIEAPDNAEAAPANSSSISAMETVTQAQPEGSNNVEQPTVKVESDVLTNLTEASNSLPTSETLNTEENPLAPSTSVEEKALQLPSQTTEPSEVVPMDTSEPPTAHKSEPPPVIKTEAQAVIPPSTSVQLSTNQPSLQSLANSDELPTITVPIRFINQPPPNSQAIASQQSITLDMPSIRHPTVAVTQPPIMQQHSTLPSATVPFTSGVQMAPSPVSQPMAVGVPSLTSVSALTSTPPIILSSPAPIMTTPSAAPVQQQTRLPGSPVGRNQKPMDVKVNPQTPPPVVPSPATNGTSLNQPRVHAPFMPVSEEKQENWMDVLHTKNTSYIVRCYFTTNEKLSKLEPDITVDKDLEFIKKKVELKPATAYKFRVAAINSCGRGPWGEVTAFKTCLPGFPGAPSSIKISKSGDGATIAWEPPLNTPGDILEYSVYLAVKPPPNAPEPKPGVPNMSFVRVYCGPSNQCNVPTGSLSQALVDTTSKPAIIFRIAAKNDKGYGPATQVRWLQESSVPNFTSTKSGLLKRSAPFTPGLSTKRGRTE